ncbi:DNA polymerase III subunit delta [Isobaculum melis]|uniref:DNA polymerase III subunit delta n=1 Tax=Isobaculum melis TaxID=142588 RepID=A0A1H9RV93_9LACT|nr:DNA polymerase III subunit delta [Isobaculum melis]SER76567.1 DNA polymerase III, delta subunit [Isobaculum melis]
MNFTKEMSKISQQQFSSVYLVLGTEAYLRDQAKASFLKNALSEDEIDLNFGSYDMNVTPLAAAIEDAASVPFFGDRRLVYIENPYFLTGERSKSKLEHDIEQLTSYLNDPPPYSVLVFFAPYEKLDERKKIVKQLKKVATIIETGALSEKDTRHFLRDYIQNEGYEISPEAFELLIQLTDANLSSAMGELPKLFLYVADTKKISKEMVTNLVPKTLEQNIFDLVPAVLNKQVEKALTIYRDLLLQKEEPIKIHAILSTHFRLMLQVRICIQKGYQQGDIASMLKIHPYRVKLAMQQVKKFDMNTLSTAFQGLVDAEYALKTGQGNREMQFELFVLKFADQHAMAN